MKNLKLNSLSRDEMRNIMAGRSSAVSSRDISDCVDQCSSDSDCNCKPCYSYPGSPMMKCKDYYGQAGCAKKICSC